MQPEILKGQYWKDNDPRIKGMRIVRVVDLRGDQVRIQTVVQKIGGQGGTGYTTWTSVERFKKAFTIMPAGVEQ